MSDLQTQHDEHEPPKPATEPVHDAGYVPDAPVPDATPAAAGDEESTVGTGTSIALGCIAGTVILIVIGLIVIGIIALVS